jgi:acetyltransferase
MDFNHYLHSLFNPRSVAIIGASARSGSFGTLIWKIAKSASPRARLFPVNPKYKTIGRETSYAALTDIKEDVDLAVLVCPPSVYPKALENCLKKGVKNILLCGGFPKSDLTEPVLEAINKTTAAGVRIVGPQSLGLMTPSEGLNLSYLPSLPPAGEVGLVSQSPGLSCTIIDYVTNAQCGFSHVIDPGFEQVLTVADYVDMLAFDRKTRCIVLYLESFQQPRKLLSAIRLAAANKPVILLKGGQTPGSADIVINNSGAREDEDGVMKRALVRAGALLVTSLKELNYAVQAFAMRKDLASGELYGLVNSKGLDSLLADHAYNNDLRLATPDSTVAKELRDKYKITFPYANPVNMGLDMDAATIVDLTDYLLNRPECSGIVLSVVTNPSFDPLELAKKLVPILKKSSKPAVTVWIGTESDFPAIKYLRKNGIVAMNDMKGACRAIRLMEQFRKFKSDGVPGSYSVIPSDPAFFASARKIIQTARREGRHLLYEEESKRLLAGIGFETTAGIYAGSLGEAIEAARALGYPVAMKLRMNGVLSKSDAKGVILGIRNERELKGSWKNMSERAVHLGQPEEGLGVFLQKTLDSDNRRELRIGMKLTRHFGPIVYLGIGGLYGKIFKGTAFNFAPLSLKEARDMISSEPFKTFLGDFQGLPPCDPEPIVTALIRLSQLAVEVPAVRSIDIDPLLCGKGHAIVLDAHCVFSASCSSISRPAQKTLLCPHKTMLRTRVSSLSSRNSLAKSLQSSELRVFRFSGRSIAICAILPSIVVTIGISFPLEFRLFWRLYREAAGYSH